tara:strand:- start:2556 stop:3977 length:1422 start_codon:yes stop_codon:yes gene_type:complete
MTKINKNSSYLKREYNKLLVRVNIPKDVRYAFDGKVEYLHALDTEDIEVANLRKVAHVDMVKTKIKAVRNGTHVNEDLAKVANYYRKLISETIQEDAKAEAQEQALNYAVEAMIPGGWSAVIKEGGANPDLYKAIQEAPAGNRAMEFLDLANSKKIPTDLHIGDFQKHKETAEKTKDENKSIIGKFALEFPFLSDIKPKSVMLWVERELDVGKKSGKTVSRYLNALNGYWKYLERMELVDPDARNPFVGHSLSHKRTSVEVLPWRDEEIVRLFKEAVDRKTYQQLPLLIVIAAYSGMRIEEICELKVGTDVDRKRMIVHEGKTNSARRAVPVHQELEDLIGHLCSTSKDNWLIPNLKAGNKYGKRSHNIAQKFGALKTDLGFPKRAKNFHSFRHSCAEKLQTAGVPEYRVQQLVGHKTGKLVGVSTVTVTDQYTTSSQDFESKDYDIKKEYIDKIQYEGLPEVISPYLKSIIL